MVGGFLVALAAVGTFAAFVSASTSHALRYVVASQTLRVGQRLDASDLGTQPMRLPESVGNGLAFRNPEALVGAVVVGPVRAGELIEAGDVSFAEHGLANRQISFSVSLSHAVDGALQSGDRVDVLATFGTGTDSSTQMVASSVEVVSVTEPSSGTSADGEPALVVTLSVPTAPEAVALAQAANAAQVTLVLSTGVAPPPVLPSSIPPTTQPTVAAAPGAT